jgi:MFS family permease
MVIFVTARGMTIPFLIIYFGQIRGFGEAIAGVGIMFNAVAGVIFTLLLAGTIDRIGARTVLIGAMIGVAVTTLAFPLVPSVPLFFLLMAIHGLAAQIFWPASDALGTAMIDMRQASQLFALLRISGAVGFGTGGLIGGFIISGGGLAEYRTMFLVSAAGAVLAALFVLVFLRVTRDVPEQDSIFSDLAEASGWRAVLADHRFLFSQFILFVLIAGFMQLQLAAPPYLRAEAGISERVIGGLFAFKTVLLVMFQMPIASRIANWGRGRAIALAGVIWIISYILIGISPWFILLPFVAVAIFAIGEMLFMPTSGVIVVDLAPERLRGRYLAVNSVAWGIAFGFSSLIAGAILGTDMPWIIWPATIAWLAAGVFGGWWYDRTAPELYSGVAPATIVGGDTYEYRQSQETT